MMSDQTDHTFVEEPPLVADYLMSLIPSGRELYEYSLSLFPFLAWIGHYNLQWLIGDLVAGRDHFPYGYTDKALTVHRYHDWRRCRSSGHGLRQVGQSRGPIRSLLFLHGCFDLLVFRNLQGYYYWCKWTLPSCAASEMLTPRSRSPSCRSLPAASLPTWPSLYLTSRAMSSLPLSPSSPVPSSCSSASSGVGGSSISSRSLPSRPS